MKSKAFILVLFSLIQSSLAFSQTLFSNPTDTIDRKLYTYAQNTPAELVHDINRLVDYLEQPAPTKKDIVKSFSYWIIQNISYDISGFLNNVYNTNGVAGTLATRRGVCQDYSELFKAMCDRAGIKCYVITGYGKAFDYKPGYKFDKANHSWNVINLDGSYYLVDLTWSSGYVDYVDDQWRYFINPDISHLFTTPELFVEKHLPADPQWQLLSHPVSMNAFMRYSNHTDMLKESSKYFNYADSIRTYETLDKDLQDLKAADDAYNFYPIVSDYAYHYYNQAVEFSNNATDSYNAAVTSYNKSINDNGGAPVASGDYNKTIVSGAISNYSKAIKLLNKIGNYADSQINAHDLLQKCNLGLDASNELLRTLR